MQTAEEKREKVTSAGDVKAMGGAQGPGKGRGPCTYRGFPLCLRRFFLRTVNYFFLPVRLLRSAWHRFRNPRVVINIPDVGFYRSLMNEKIKQSLIAKGFESNNFNSVDRVLVNHPPKITIAPYRPGDVPPPSGIEISGEWFDESPDENIMECISKCAVNYDSGYIHHLLSPEYPSVDDMSLVEYDRFYGNRGDTVHDTIFSKYAAADREIDSFVLPDKVLGVILTKAHEYADAQCPDLEDRAKKYFKCFENSVRMQKRAIRNDYYFEKNRTDNKKLFCDCNSSLRNGCDYDEAVAVMVGKKYFINDKFSANTKDMIMTSEVVFITMLFSLAKMALYSAIVNSDDWAGDDGSLAIVLREGGAYDKIGGTYRMVVDAMCPRTWRILATATICDDRRCVVVESDGKESVCEATLRDDLPHREET